MSQPDTIFELKIIKKRLQQGLCPRTHLGSLQCSTTPAASRPGDEVKPHGEKSGYGLRSTSWQKITTIQFSQSLILPPAHAGMVL